MALVINIVAREQSNAIRDALSTPPSNEDVARSFAFAERGVFANPDTHSRTGLNGGWIGVIAITRNPDGTVEAQRTWGLSDAQQAASGLTTPAAINAFAARLADDVHVKLIEWASRNRGGQIGDFWQVVGIPSAATVAPQSEGWSAGAMLFASVAVASVVGVAVFANRK
jgi:hypothetical protein